MIKFKYQDKVQVKKGFYVGGGGYVEERHEESNKYIYLIKLVELDGKKIDAEYVGIKEEDLGLVEIR